MKNEIKKNSNNLYNDFYSPKKFEAIKIDMINQITQQINKEQKLYSNKKNININNCMKKKDICDNLLIKKNLNNNINNSNINKNIKNIRKKSNIILKRNSNLVNENNKRKTYLIKIDLTKIDKNNNYNLPNKPINDYEKNIYNNNNHEKDLTKNKNEPLKSYAFVEYPNKKHREFMEDFHDFKNLSFDNFIIYYFSIFDGHNGKDVSFYLKNNFHAILSTELKKLVFSEESQLNKEKIISSINKSFEIIDTNIINDKSIKDNVGSTGTIILLYRDINNFSQINLICANIGDSKGFLVTNENISQMTKDHNCDDKSEVERIKKHEGLVFRGRVFGSLIITRSFGDKEMKSYGVISTPHVFVKAINKNDLYAIICSDGVWDVCSKEDILELSKNNISSEELSKQIVKLAIEKGSSDNISCLVIKLNIKH